MSISPEEAYILREDGANQGVQHGGHFATVSPWKLIHVRLDLDMRGTLRHAVLLRQELNHTAAFGLRWTWERGERSLAKRLELLELLCQLRRLGRYGAFALRPWRRHGWNHRLWQRWRRR